MARKWYLGYITLSKLNNAVVKPLKGKNGDVRCLIIPIDQNFITEFKNENGSKFDLSIRAGFESSADDKNQIAIITHSVDSKTYKAATDEEKEKFKDLPILGNFFEFSGGGSASESVSEIGADEDLPF